MKKVLNIFLSILIILIVCLIAYTIVFFSGTEEKDSINSWFTSNEYGIAFQDFSESLYKNYYSGDNSSVVLDIKYKNIDTYLFLRGNDEDSGIDRIDEFDVNEMFYQLDRSLSRRFLNISIIQDEVIFYDEYTGNQLIYSITGSEPENNLFLSKQLRFTKYNDNWYSYFEPFKEQSEWRKTVLFVLADIFVGIIISLALFFMVHLNKKEKAFNPLALSIITLMIMFFVTLSYFISHATYYKYNNFFIDGKNLDEIEAKYGECSFVHLKSDNSGYAGYQMNSVGKMYLMHFNEKGVVYKINTGVGPGG